MLGRSSIKKNVTASMIVFLGVSVKCPCYAFVLTSALAVDIAVVDFVRLQLFSTSL